MSTPRFAYICPQRMCSISDAHGCANVGEDMDVESRQTLWIICFSNTRNLEFNAGGCCTCPPRFGRMNILIIWILKSKLKKKILICRYPKRRDALHGQGSWPKFMKFMPLPVQDAILRCALFQSSWALKKSRKSCSIL